MCRLVSYLVFIEFNAICVLFVYALIILVQPEILQDSSYGTHKYITANGIKFHYVANGTEGKPLMLFLHGFPEVSCHCKISNYYIMAFLVLVLMAISVARI